MTKEKKELIKTHFESRLEELRDAKRAALQREHLFEASELAALIAINQQWKYIYTKGCK